MNKIMLIGNVGKDPEVKYVEQGVAVARLSLATTERGYALPNGTQVPDRTDWHNVILWRRLAEVVEKYVHKGDKLYVEGAIRYRNYDDQNGVKRYVTEIFVDSFEMLSSRGQQKQQDVSAQAANPESQVPPKSESDLPF